MNDVATKKDIKISIQGLEERMNRRMDKRFDELMAVLSQFANDVQAKLAEHDEEFVKVHAEFSNIHTVLASHGQQLNKLHQQYDHLMVTVDGFVERIDHYETEQAARDHTTNRHNRWIRKIAAKTDVKLT